MTSESPNFNSLQAIDQRDAEDRQPGLVARQVEDLEQRLPKRFELCRRQARQGPLHQPLIVDGAHLINQGVRILFQFTGRANANPEGLGAIDELCSERDHKRRRMLGIEQGLSLDESPDASCLAPCPAGD